VGWSTEHFAYTFPMSNDHGEVVGIRLRRPNGIKFSVRGGHEGLFLPAGMPTTGSLLIAEGATDTAALLDLGFTSVGRPSCAGGVGVLVGFVRVRDYRELVIVADRDEPGRVGADMLASTLRVHHRSVRVIMPPPGVKDTRDWVRSGATVDEFKVAIERAPWRTIQVQGVAR
jgi:hypothetical protein